MFIESLFEKYGGHAGRAAGVPLRGLFSFLGKMLILSGMASSPPRPKKTKVLGGREVGAWGRGEEAFLPESSLSPTFLITFNFIRTRVKNPIRALVALLIAASPAFAEEAKELNVFSWSENIPQEVVNGFTKETGIKVKLHL